MKTPHDLRVINTLVRVVCVMDRQQRGYGGRANVSEEDEWGQAQAVNEKAGERKGARKTNGGGTGGGGQNTD